MLSMGFRGGCLVLSCCLSYQTDSGFLQALLSWPAVLFFQCVLTCPSSYKLEHLSDLLNRGSGSFSG